MQDINTKLKEFIDRYRKEWPLVAVTIVFTILLVIGFSFIPNLVSGINSIRSNVPEEFLDARSRAGDAANRITNLTDTYGEGLEKISEAERNGNYTAGLNLIFDETNKNEEVRQAAVDLSKELNGMAVHLNAVQPEMATAVALSAITTGIELVERLISYNNNTRDLLNTLQLRLRDGDDEKTRKNIEALISEMNEQANVINSLGREYRDLMIQFDGLTE